jgi:hypothetical protein
VSDCLQLGRALAGIQRFPNDHDLPQPGSIYFEPYWGERFVGAADPISAASRDVFQSDIERSWARTCPWFLPPLRSNVSPTVVKKIPGLSRGTAGGTRDHGSAEGTRACSLSHGGDGCEPRRATSSFSFYGLWASCVGEFCWSPLRAAARDCYSRRDGTAFSAGLKKCSKEREL